MTTTYLVPGMTCDHCKVAVTEEVTKVDGVALVAAIDEAGYDAVAA